MKKLEQFFGKRVFGKGSPRSPAFRGATLDEMKRSGHTGRSMIEMLGVLAIIGVLSVAALAGLTYAMNKHRANTIYNDVHLLALHVMDTGKDTVPADFYPDSGRTYSLDTTTYADGFVVKVADVSEKVCDRIMEVNDPSIEKIYVGSEETTTCSGTQTMGFMFLYDGALASGGSGTDPDPVDPCEGIIPSTDCSIASDETDSNGCVTVQKITCTGDTYCSVNTCEPCPAAETCEGESCCALTGPNDVCGRPTKEIGTISVLIDSALNENGCCYHPGTTQESCSLYPITPETCTPTCDGTCQSDGSCRPNCETGSTYNETAGKCCEDLTAASCQMLTSAASGVCPALANVADGTACTTTEGTDGTCQSGVCEATVTASCDEGTTVTGLNNSHEYCMSNGTMTWSNAFTWCEARGRHLASMEEMCPGWDGEVGDEKCSNLVGASSESHCSWSATPFDSIKAFYVVLSTGNVGSTINAMPTYYAFCW